MGRLPLEEPVRVEFLDQFRVLCRADIVVEPVGSLRSGGYLRRGFRGKDTPAETEGAHIDCRAKGAEADDKAK